MAKGVVGLDELLYLPFQVIDFEFVFLWNHRPVHINGNFNRRHFNRNLDPSLYFNGSIDVNWLIDVHGLLNDGRDLNGLNDFPRRFIAWLDRNFLLDFNILRDFNDLLNDPFRPGDIPGNLDNYFHRLLNYDLFDNFFCNMG